MPVTYFKVKPESAMYKNFFIENTERKKLKKHISEFMKNHFGNGKHEVWTTLYPSLVMTLSSEKAKELSHQLCKGTLGDSQYVFKGNNGDRCYYSLCFRPIDPRALDLTPKRKSVEISFDIGSNTWDMDNDGIVAAFKEVLKDRPVYVHKGRLFSSVNISTEEESEEEKRQKILKKLSPEERRILGIEE